MVKFAYIDRSDDQFTPPGVTFLTVNSPALQCRGNIALYLPEVAKGCSDIPVIVMLHGVCSSHLSWLYQAGAHKVLDELIANSQCRPFALVLPSDGMVGDGSGYLAHDNADYARWIYQDSLDAARQSLSEISDQSPVFITGLSMGGYGALNLGFNHPDIFQGVSAHSPITRLEQLNDCMFHSVEELPIQLGQETSILSLAKSKADQLPRFRFDCGKEDWLYTANIELHESLVFAGIDHQFDDLDGGHDYTYWHRQIENSFRFFENYFSF